MLVEIAYGEGRLPVHLPDTSVVVRPSLVPGLPDEARAIRQALQHPLGCAPLRELVQQDDQVVILFSDITRPMPSNRVLPVLLDE